MVRGLLFVGLSELSRLVSSLLRRAVASVSAFGVFADVAGWSLAGRAVVVADRQTAMSRATVATVAFVGDVVEHSHAFAPG